MEAVLWVLLPGFVALASGLLVWFVMESRMEVRLAQERESFAAERFAVEARKVALESSLEPSLRAAEESAKRIAFESFLDELRVEQRHYTRQSRIGYGRKSLVLQERIYFRNLPLSEWIEHEIAIEEGADVQRMVRDMTVFEKPLVSIAEIQTPRKALA